MDKQELIACKQELENHLINELLPFWVTRTVDKQYGGFLTHFDKDGLDSGEDEKSLIAQTRSVLTYSTVHRAGYGQGKFAEMAKHGVDFLLNKMWDHKYGGFYWMMKRNGEVKINKKIVYGLSFAIYSLSEYTLATGDKRGREFAEKTFDLLQKYAADTMYGGYFEMFEQDWTLCGPGAQGGDRKTLDVHMHLMEAFTSLFECTQLEIHRRKLLEDIEIMLQRILHPKYKTGVPQFYKDWTVAPQIKFEIIWGWDRFNPEGKKGNATDNTSFAHNTEFAWLFLHALNILGIDPNHYRDLFATIFEHTIKNGIDWEYGGVYVEGPHAGGVYDMEKEYWQQAEVLIGMLDAYQMFGKEDYWKVYKNVHRFIMDKMVHRPIGEWWPLLTREGKPIWTHMGHSWKINYHDARSMLKCIAKLNELIKGFEKRRIA
jgi:mannose/cellobiose epimerase-like protein (N-acyl-D-glucosamine 2-epimerase family)